MKYSLALTLLLFLLTANAQESTRSVSDLINDSQNAALKKLINSDSYMERNIVLVAQDGSRIRKSQKDIDDAVSTGSQYYKEEKFDRAFSALSELAVIGIKEAQTIIGLMYLQGQHVQKSTVAGMGWLGVANETKKNKSAKKAYKQVYSQLSDEHKKVIDQTVTEYVKKYGMKTQNVVCKKVKKTGSNISESVCVKSADSESPYHPLI